jgi:hypothetical protein
MQDVYFKKTNTTDTNELSKIAKQLFHKIIHDKDIKLEKDAVIKVHFGEKGNETYLPANIYNELITYLKENNSSPSYIETNVLYRGARTNRTNHIKLAKEHGFTQIPIVIADGEIGEDYYEAEINKQFFKTCKIAKEYQKHNQVIVCSHFKGHIVAGFGGALKQLGMGFAARGGKLAQHSQMKPSVKPEKCILCGLCVEKCDVKAIELKEYAVIDHNTCVGCAGCIAVCPQGAISHDWNATNFQERLMEYAYAAQQNKTNIYISFLINITKDCDCMGEKMPLITNNIGVMVSLNPVAIDSACLDIVQQESKQNLFEAGRNSLKYAEEIGLGSTKYRIIEV